MEEIKTPTGDRITVLLKFATIAAAIADHHLSSEKFIGVIKFAIEQKITNALVVGRIISADEARVHEWVSGQNYPTVQEQAIILHKLANDAEVEARSLRSGSPKN